MADFPIKLTVVAHDGGQTRLAARGGFEFAVPTDALPVRPEPGESFACPLGLLVTHLDHDAGRSLLNDAILFAG
jgi:hypothetical protein